MTQAAHENWLAQEQDIVPKLIGALEASSLAELGAKLEEALPHMQEHFTEEEQPGGLFDAMREEAPRTDHALKALQAEHEDLLVAARGILDKLAAGDEEAADAARQAFVTALRRHNQEELNLLTEVYSRDLGGQ